MTTIGASFYPWLRVRCFSDGAVFGGKVFVKGIREAQRERFSPKTKQ